MDIKTCVKDSFCVIGKEGSTNDGPGFINRLWSDANNHFEEVASLAKKDENGIILGFWGAMSDFARNFLPWENNFTKGLYLAGVEVYDNVQAPPSWEKWIIPSYEYLYVKVTGEMNKTFSYMLNYLDEFNLQLCGAVQDYIYPKENGQLYLFFPIRKL